MSQVQDPELSLLGAQLDELQAHLERRLDEERQTRQQTLVGLERWISDRLAERDRVMSARLAEAVTSSVVSSSIRNEVTPASVRIDPGSDSGTSGDSAELLGLIHALRARVDALDAQMSFLNARQDEFTVLIATVREWVVKHPKDDSSKS